MLIFWFWSLPEQFWRFLKVFGKFKKSKMADPRWPPFENKTLLWRHMTSLAEVADLNGNIFGRIIWPLSFVVTALIFSELRGGAESAPPRSHKTIKSPVWTGLRERLEEPDLTAKLNNILNRWILSRGPLPNYHIFLSWSLLVMMINFPSFWVFREQFWVFCEQLLVSENDKLLMYSLWPFLFVLFVFFSEIWIFTFQIQNFNFFW